MTQREEEIASTMPADLDALPRLRGFRLRGMEMTRLETFIDAAFAFAISMLVIAPSRSQIISGVWRIQKCAAFVCSIAVGIFGGAMVVEALRPRRWRVVFL